MVKDGKESEDLKSKYKERLKRELDRNLNETSRDYKTFMSEYREVPTTYYEKVCKFFEKINITPDANTSEKIRKDADFCNLQVTPAGVYSFAIVGPLILALILLMPILIFFNGSAFLLILTLVGCFGSIRPLMNMPSYIADNFRLKASNQMVLSIFYIVTYMRHTSNLERAIEFAADHLAPPLSNEFKKIVWDIETEKFDSISDSLDNFLESWREHNPEFIDAMHLIQGSLLEGSEDKRLEMLEKSLDLILDETFEKMLHFAHNLQSPITTLHMLGVILPILGLVILPLMMSFMGDDIKWYHIAILYNIFLPILVYLFGQRILSKRPSGYGKTSLDSKEVKEALHTNVVIGKMDLGISPKTFAIIFFMIFALIGFSPLIMHSLHVNDFGWGDETELLTCGRSYCFMDYRIVEGTGSIPDRSDGPFGLGAAVVSLGLILAIGVGPGLYYKFKTKKVIKIFEKSKRLENEFSSALFQLGNRLGDNLPAEIATLKVANSLGETDAGNFFQIIAINIQKLGMSIYDSIFNKTIGALVYYPSNLIDSSMRVLIQSVKKGPLIAAKALINISRYVKEMHKVEERLRDLMAEVISSMKSQISFLTPIIAAIVVGITSMISSILGVLSQTVSSQLTEGSSGGFGGNMEMLGTFLKEIFQHIIFK